MKLTPNYYRVLIKGKEPFTVASCLNIHDLRVRLMVEYSDKLQQIVKTSLDKDDSNKIYILKALYRKIKW